MTKLQIYLLIPGKKYALQFVQWIVIQPKCSHFLKICKFLSESFNVFSIREDVQHAITMHEDIANVLDKDIQSHCNQPKFEKVSLKAHCKRCNTEVFTRVDSGATDCERMALGWCFCCCWCLVATCLRCETSSYDGLPFLSDVTQKVYQHSCPQCHNVIGEFHTRMSRGKTCIFILPFLIAFLLILILVIVILSNQSH